MRIGPRRIRRPRLSAIAALVLAVLPTGTSVAASGSVAEGTLVFRDNAATAIVGSSAKPVANALGPNHRGPQDPAVICPGSGHGVYVIGDNACALNTTTSFLVDGKLPEHDMSCKWSAGAGSCRRRRRPLDHF